MNFSPFSRKPTKKPPGRSSSSKRKSDLEVQLELTSSQKREVERKAAEMQRKIEEIPRRIKRLKDEERRKIKQRAVRTPTMKGVGSSFYKLPVVHAGVKLTRSQRRILRNRLILLSAVLMAVLVLLWKTVR
jgi:hypothetical protein